MSSNPSYLSSPFVWWDSTAAVAYVLKICTIWFGPIDIRKMLYSRFWYIILHSISLLMSIFSIYSPLFSSNWVPCSCNFCFSNNSSNFSVADCSISTGFDSSSAGKVVTLSSGFASVYGVHGPWIEGISVWVNFRKRVPLEFLFWVRKRCTHFVTSSSVQFRAHNQWRSPFKYSATMTGIRCRLGFTYTTTPGLLVEKSTNLFSKKSLEIKLNSIRLDAPANFIWKCHAVPHSFAGTIALAELQNDALQLTYVSADTVLERCSRETRFHK